jgi:uncharacterized protein
VAIILRDAVWGDLELEPELVDLLQCAELQRLRWIRQLGTANLVYPSANHTRFEHSLGTCHVAGRMLDQLQVSDPELRRLVQIAALIHDVGHVPFGHTFEDERRIFPRHDGPQRTAHFLGDQTQLGQALGELGIRQQLLGFFGAGGTPPPALVSDLVSGTICSDLLDYLARDAFFTGIRRTYDERLFRYFALREGRLVLRLAKGGLRREDAFSEVVHLLRLRYTLTERVYFHHAKVSSGALISKLVELAVKGGLVVEDLYRVGDEGLLNLLGDRYAEQDPVLRRLLEDLRARRLPKRAYVLTRRVGAELQEDLIARFHREPAQREQVEAELERDLGLDPGEVIIYCPARGMAQKEARVRVEVGAGEVVSLADLQLREVEDLLEKHQDLWKFYVFVSSRHVSKREALADACQERFGVPSELAF